MNVIRVDAQNMMNLLVGKIEFLFHDNEMPYISSPSTPPSRSPVKSEFQYTTRGLLNPTWDDRGDHMQSLSSAIPAIGTIEAIAIARIAQVLSQTIRAIGAIN